MTTSTILLKTPIVFQVPSSTSSPSVFDRCALMWEQDSLTVTSQSFQQKVDVPALKNQAWLQDCLMRSPIQKVYLDPKIDDSMLKAWADICHATGKQVYLAVPSSSDLPQQWKPWHWRVKRLADWLTATVSLMILSPLLLLIAALIRMDSSGPIFFQQWRVGYQGRLFRIIKFRSMRSNAESQHHQVMGKQGGLHKLQDDPRVTGVGRWLRKFSLDELPQLINVMRGEMSLVGPRPWALYDAIRIRPELQQRLNALPGITGAWQVSTRSNELDLYAVTCRDLAYLQQWRLWKDLNVLLLTLPKVLFGTGAY